MFNISGNRLHMHLYAVLTALTLFLFMRSVPVLAQELTLPDILRKTAAYSPTAIANAARVRAAEAGLDQAGMGPNPALAVEVEDFGGSGAYSRFAQSEASLYYEQKWELGGKREARTELARAELGLARNRANLNALDLVAEVQSAWIEALAAAERVPLMKQRLSTAKALEREVTKRTESGLDPLFTRERMRATAAQAAIAYEQAVENARIALVNLASYWGGEDDLVLDRRAFLHADPQPETADPEDMISPDLETLKAKREAAGAQMELERARGVQDPTIRAGVRRFSSGNDVAFVVGFSIPLAFHDTNRGNIQRAQAERLAAEADIAIGRQERQREISRLLASRRALANEITRIDSEILPSATRAAASARDGFRRGGTAFTLFEVTEAQRAEVDIRLNKIDLLRRFHLHGMRLDRLSGKHLAAISNPVNNP